MRWVGASAGAAGAWGRALPVWGGDAHTGLMSAEPVTAVDAPDDGNVRCWCCSTVEPPDRMVHLGDHPEVHLCLRCAHVVRQQAWQIEDEGRDGLRAWVRGGFRDLRAEVVRRGWHWNRFVGGRLRGLGRHLP